MITINDKNEYDTFNNWSYENYSFLAECVIWFVQSVLHVHCFKYKFVKKLDQGISGVGIAMLYHTKCKNLHRVF